MIRKIQAFLFTGIWSLLAACSGNIQKQSASSAGKIPFADSILKYDTGTNAGVEWSGNPDNGMMLIANVNKSRIAIIAIEHRLFYWYRKTGQHWELADSLKEELFPELVWLTDLNGDGFDDFRFSFPIMRGNYDCVVFLYDPQTMTFRHHRFFDQMNIGYDTSTSLVRISCLGGLHDNVKELYRISGDSLVFYKGVEMSVGVRRTGELTYYGNVNGRKTRIRTIVSNPDNIADKFDTTYWSDGPSYFSNGTSL